MKSNNDIIIARIKGQPSQPGTLESDADPTNPNVTTKEHAAGSTRCLPRATKPKLKIVD